MYIADAQWPWPHHPARPDDQRDGLTTDQSVTVTAFQLRPGTIAAAAEWAGAQQIILDGAPALQLPDSSPDSGVVVRLGDYLVRDQTDELLAVPADRFHQRYQPAKT